MNNDYASYGGYNPPPNAPATQASMALVHPPNVYNGSNWNEYAAQRPPVDPATKCPDCGAFSLTIITTQKQGPNFGKQCYVCKQGACPDGKGWKGWVHEGPPKSAAQLQSQWKGNNKGPSQTQQRLAAMEARMAQIEANIMALRNEYSTVPDSPAKRVATGKIVHMSEHMTAGPTDQSLI